MKRIAAIIFSLILLMSVTSCEKNFSQETTTVQSEISIVMPNESGAYQKVSNSEAMVLIQNYIDTLSEDAYGYGEKVVSVTAWDEDAVFEKTGMQAYTVNTSQGPIGEYLICRKWVCQALFLGELTTADIDFDGEYELINICGFDGGIFRYNITVYKYGNPPYFNSLTKILYPAYQNIYVPTNGYAELSIKKVSETELHLIGEKNIDYGVIKFKDEKLYVDSEDFPFSEWK